MVDEKFHLTSLSSSRKNDEFDLVLSLLVYAFSTTIRGVIKNYKVHDGVPGVFWVLISFRKKGIH